MDNNLILIDWLSITSKVFDYLDFERILGMDCVPWEQAKGAHGYQDRLYFAGVSIHYNGRDDMGTWLEMSGQGCRTFESLGSNNYELLFSQVERGNAKITRLDVAYDDHVGLLDLDVLADATLHDCFVSKSRFWEVDISSKGKTIYHGSPQSDIRIRIYDKARERNCEDGVHWMMWQREYPKAKTITNLGYALEDDVLDTWEKLLDYKNGIYGVICLMDEMQNWFSSNNSKNFPPEMLEVICQNRKNRRVIMGTAQSFNRLAKPIREQATEVRKCWTLFGSVTIVQRVIPELNSAGDVVRWRHRGFYYFVHTDELRDSYDTYKVIEALRSAGFQEKPLIHQQHFTTFPGAVRQRSDRRAGNG